MHNAQLDSVYSFDSVNAALLPAKAPVLHAICRLNPPVWASTSIISPAKYRLWISLLRMVPGSISFTLTPPRVTMASAIGRGAFTVSGRALSVASSVSRWAAVIWLQGRTGEMPQSRGKISARLAGSSPGRTLFSCFFPASEKSRRRRASSCSRVRPGFRSMERRAPLAGSGRWQLASSARGPEIPKWVKSISPSSE